MNTPLSKLLKRHPDYFALMAATFLSGLGNTLTGIAIFHELARLKADSMLYSIAFALTILPGLISSHWGGKLLERFSASKLMIVLEIFGSSVISISWVGASLDSVPLLLTALPLSSVSYGILVPFVSTYTRERFEDHDLLAVAEMTNLALVLDFLLGSFLGVLCIDLLGVENFFLMDILTYWIAAIVIFLLSKQHPEPFRRAESKLEEGLPFLWRTLSSEQQKAFLLYPALVASCAPCTAILPGAASVFGDAVHWGLFAISPPLVLLLFKTQGQFLGPFFVRRLNIDRIRRLRPLCLACLAAFLVCYTVALRAPSLGVAAAFVFLAHLFSNVVFTISFIEFRKAFTSESIGAAAVRQYQLGVFIIVLSSLVGGLLTTAFSNLAAVALGSVGLTSAFFLTRTGKAEMGLGQ